MPPKRKWMLAAAAVAASLALVSMGDARGFRRYFGLRKELVQLSEKNHQLAEDNARLTREIEALRSDPKALERAAREDLGYVKPGEWVLNLE